MYKLPCTVRKDLNNKLSNCCEHIVVCKLRGTLSCKHGLVNMVKSIHGHSTRISCKDVRDVTFSRFATSRLLDSLLDNQRMMSYTCVHNSP